MHEIRQVAPRDERGASAVEYGLLIAGIAAGLIGSLHIYGFLMQGIFGGYCQEVNNGKPC